MIGRRGRTTASAAITVWALWGGVAMMTTASLFAFFAKPQILVSAFRGLFRRQNARRARAMCSRTSSCR